MRYIDSFFFSPGASFGFFTVLPLSEKLIKERFPAVYRRFLRQWGLPFSNKSHPKLIRRKLDWTGSTIFQNDILKKRQAALDTSPELAGGTSRKAGSIRPFPGSNTPPKVLKPPFSVLKNSLPIELALARLTFSWLTYATSHAMVGWLLSQ